MHELYELKDKLCNELKEFNKKEKLDMTSIQTIDTLAHALKNVCKIIEYYENEDSADYSYAPAMPRMPRMSYGRGRNAKRDSMGRYSSRDDSFMMEMRELIDNAPNEMVRQKLMDTMNSV